MGKELDSAIDTSKKQRKWNQDPKGYFTIRPFPERGKIFVRYYTNNHRLVHTFSGNKTVELIHEIVERGLVSRLEHAGYLGREIEKAHTAMRLGIEYVQDSELGLRKE